ncbi:hypothetical protein ACS0TY_009798 [Phlomoides rotata]
MRAAVLLIYRLDGKRLHEMNVKCFVFRNQRTMLAYSRMEMEITVFLEIHHLRCYGIWCSVKIDVN